MKKLQRKRYLVFGFTCYCLLISLLNIFQIRRIYDSVRDESAYTPILVRTRQVITIATQWPFRHIQIILRYYINLLLKY